MSEREKEHHETDAVTASARELRYLRKVAQFALDLGSPVDVEPSDIRELQEIAERALNIGKLTRTEIVKKARTAAAASRSVAAKKRHAMVLTEIGIIQQELGPKWTLRGLAKALDARGVKPVKSENWNEASVRYILKTF